MPISKELTIRIEDKPGTLAQFGAEAFADVPEEFQADVEFFLMKPAGGIQ
jgi:hypothetical protein